MMGENLNFREHTQLKQIICKQSNDICLVAGKMCGGVSRIYQTFVPKMPSSSKHGLHLRLCTQHSLKQPAQLQLLKLWNLHFPFAGGCLSFEELFNSLGLKRPKLKSSLFKNLFGREDILQVYTKIRILYLVICSKWAQKLLSWNDDDDDDDINIHKCQALCKMCYVNYFS